MTVPRPRTLAPLHDRDSSDPARRAAELVQRGRMILDVAAADLDAAERRLDGSHPTVWYFRSALQEAQRAWDRLRADLGPNTFDAALKSPPLTVLTLGENPNGTPRALLIPIAGQTYRAEPIVGTPLAPIQWRLTRLAPALADGPYYVCRLDDGSTQCDCAGWTYRIAGNDTPAVCKHIHALAALGWI